MSQQDESLLSYLNRRKPRPKPQGTKPQEPQLQWFNSGECHGCIYKRTAYCYNQCSINVWAKREAFA